MEFFQTVIDSLIKTSPVFALLCIAIYYLYKQNEELKSKNEELNSYIRSEADKNLNVLSSVSSTLNKVVDNTNQQIINLKEFITIKIDTLK